METQLRPPRDDLFRALLGVPIDVQRDDTTDEGPVLAGHFAVFNVWTEIDSYWEGKFLERIAPGSFKKTIKDRAAEIRCLFQHGFDYTVGDKPLGPFRSLTEDEVGVYYEVPLLDTSYNAEIIPGLEAGLYGASFRFRVMREEMVEDPGVSDHNPKGLPERTIKEVMLLEGGPVTFGAYPEATAGLRSMPSLTDQFLLDRLAADPDRLRSLIEAREARVAAMAARDTADVADDASKDGVQPDAPADEAESPDDASREDTTPTEPASDATPRKPVKDYLNPKEAAPSWMLQ